MDLQKLRKASNIRLLVQGAFATFCLFIGWRFFQFVMWALGRSETAVARPASVEGFLPISAFLAFKRFLVTGLWDTVHPAGLTIFVAAIVIAILARKGFCGYICPVGFASRALAAAGRRLRISLTPPRWMHMGLAVFKYLLFGFFAVTVLRMDAASIEAFLRAPYNLTADAKMLQFFLHPSGTALLVFAVIGVLGLVVPYFWCRYLCPYGAMLGLFSFLSPLAIKRDESACISCGKCRRVCPGGIRVDTKARVNSPECIGCMKCVDVCPAKDCLSPQMPLIGKVSPYTPAVCSVAILLIFYIWGVSTGHWESNMPIVMLKRFYAMHLAGM